jgi:hypothetical protein
MPFDPNSAKKAGKKSKRGPAKKEGPSVKEKMELLYEKVFLIISLPTVKQQKDDTNALRGIYS